MAMSVCVRQPSGRVISAMFRKQILIRVPGQFAIAGKSEESFLHRDRVARGDLEGGAVELHPLSNIPFGAL